jgi:allantoinase
MSDNFLYDYSPITERPKVEWPEGKRVAFYCGLNIEHFRMGMPATSASPLTAGMSPDPMNHGWRDYGTRVGIWRMMELFDEVGLRASAITNSEVIEEYPQIIEAGIERDWAWLAHGKTNSTLHTGFSEEDETVFLDELFTMWHKVGLQPQGWLGPALTETYSTPKLLAERGIRYLLDWNADDRPFPLKVGGLIEVPYSMDVNDISVFVGHPTAPSVYEEMAMAQLEILLEEGGGVFALPVHPFVVGQPFRFKHFRNIIRAITSHPDVWVTTSEDIANHFLSTPAAPTATA